MQQYAYHHGDMVYALDHGYVFNSYLVNDSYESSDFGSYLNTYLWACANLVTGHSFSYVLLRPVVLKTLSPNGYVRLFLFGKRSIELTRSFTFETFVNGIIDKL
ncbi:hypothetical protein QTP88_005190 [Uroleucon formosanum]